MQCFDSTDSTNSTENTRLKQQHALNPQALSTCQAPWATSPASPRHLKNLPNTAHRDALSCSSDGQRQHCQGQRMDPQPCTYSQEIMLCNARLVDLPSLALLHPSHPKTSSLPALIPTEAHLPLQLHVEVLDTLIWENAHPISPKPQHACVFRDTGYRLTLLWGGFEDCNCSRQTLCLELS